MSRDIKYIVVHEADCPLLKPSGSEFTINDIDSWHIERGFQRTDAWRKKWHPDLKSVGYHFVIGVKGDIWEGRHQDEVPAAVQGFNSNSLNICMIGQGKYTAEQWAALKFLITNLHDNHRGAEIVGHCHPLFKSGKTCPDFDVPAWATAGMVPPDLHVAILGGNGNGTTTA